MKKIIFSAIVAMILVACATKEQPQPESSIDTAIVVADSTVAVDTAKVETTLTIAITDSAK